MPFDHPGTMTTDEIYSSTAYVLFKKKKPSA
jgi:hypothetical protein